MVTVKQFFRMGYNKIYNDDTVIFIYKGGLDCRITSGHWFHDSVLDYLSSNKFEVTYYKKEDYMNGHSRLDIVIDRI